MTPETATACLRAEGGFDALTKVTFLYLDFDFGAEPRRFNSPVHEGLGYRAGFT